MEKFSAYRDAGTGIQPFLNPVPPVSSKGVAEILLFPIGLVAGTLRTALCLLVLLLYVVLVQTVCLIFYPIPPLYRLISGTITRLLARLALLVIGFYWIPVSINTRKRGRAARDALAEPWSPGAGDLVISNWASYIEILYLAFRFQNPVFVLPIAVPPLPSSPSGDPSASRATGRKTGTGSANIALPSASAGKERSREPILGFREVSLLEMIASAGRVPPYSSASGTDRLKSLEDIRKSAKGPVVLFPECTTSNGRALLRFTGVFEGLDVKVPVRKFGIFVMCVRYDAPTLLSPTLTLSLPSSPPTSSAFSSLIRHLFGISTSLAPTRPISIRLLPPSEAPSAATFVVSDVVSGGGTGGDAEILREACETLVAGLGKMKRTQLGWEDKAGLIDIYYGRRR